MKNWSLKKKSVDDEIAANKPKFQTNLSITHILKLNFLPIIFLVYSVVVILVVLLFMS